MGPDVHDDANKNVFNALFTKFLLVIYQCLLNQWFVSIKNIFNRINVDICTIQDHFVE